MHRAPIATLYVLVLVVRIRVVEIPEDLFQNEGVGVCFAKGVLSAHALDR